MTGYSDCTSLWLCFTCDQPDVVHDHPLDGEDLQRGCQVQTLLSEPTARGAAACGELVGYVDDGAYSFANSDPYVISEVLTQKHLNECDLL